MKKITIALLVLSVWGIFLASSFMRAEMSLVACLTIAALGVLFVRMLVLISWGTDVSTLCRQLKIKFDSLKVWEYCPNDLMEKLIQKGRYYVSVEKEGARTLTVYFYGGYRVQFSLLSETIDGLVLEQDENSFARFASRTLWRMKEFTLFKGAKAVQTFTA